MHHKKNIVIKNDTVSRKTNASAVFMSKTIYLSNVVQRDRQEIYSIGHSLCGLHRCNVGVNKYSLNPMLFQSLDCL